MNEISTNENHIRDAETLARMKEKSIQKYDAEHYSGYVSSQSNTSSNYFDKMENGENVPSKYYIYFKEANCSELSGRI